MLSLAERWCDLSPVGRICSWLTVVLIAGAILCSSLSGGKGANATSGLQAQWRKLVSLSVDNTLPPQPLIKPFSALDFEFEGSAVVSWQPAKTGGELVLCLQWESLLSLFSLLAERNMALSRFSILPTPKGLQMTLQLEAISNE